MLTSRKSRRLRERQGSRHVSLAELRSCLEAPSSMSDGHRQRLIELAQQVAGIQLLGGEYARVGLSEIASAAIGRHTTAV